MAVSYAVFFALYAISMVIAVFAGLLVLVGWKDMFWRKTLSSLKYNAVYIGILAGFPVLMTLLGLILGRLSNPQDYSKQVVYTNWILGLAGGEIRALQDRLDYKVLTDFFIVTYVWLFTFMLIFVPMLLLVKGDHVNLRKYSVALMLNYIVLILFYTFFPVTVTGSSPDSGITPQLYVSPNWGRLVTSIDPLNNDFPSAHVGLTTTSFLIFALAGPEYRKFSYFLGAMTVVIIFAVLYLGIHWPADVFAGFALAVAAVVAARSDRVQMTVDRYVRTISSKLFGE